MLRPRRWVLLKEDHRAFSHDQGFVLGRSFFCPEEALGPAHGQARTEPIELQRKYRRRRGGSCTLVLRFKIEVGSATSEALHVKSVKSTSVTTENKY